MCENAYLSIKNPKASRALKGALDPGRRMLASLARLRFATSATVGLRSWAPPLDQILDPHLETQIGRYMGDTKLWVYFWLNKRISPDRIVSQFNECCVRHSLWHENYYRN